MKKILYILTILPFLGWSQGGPPNDCGEAVTVCDQSTFNLTSDNSTNDVVDVTAGTVSNPSSNPNSAPGNSGCLLSGETSSTFMILTANSAGELEWSIGFNGNTGCYDWIMWEYSPGVCADIHNNVLPPVACNWNATCSGYTGMTAPGNLPPGANQGDFEYSITVNPGDQFLLLLSNYSFQNTPVNFTDDIAPNSASLVCTNGAGGTICQGDTTSITADANNLTNKTYSWSPATDLDDPNTMTTDAWPSTTTDYTCTISGINQQGNPGTETVTVTVTVETAPVPDAGTDITTCYATNSQQLNGTPEDVNNTFHWEFVGPTGTPAPPNAVFSPSNADATPTVSVNYAGTYQFVLVEENSTGCVGTDTVEVFFQDPSHSTNLTDPLCNGGNTGSIEVINPDGAQYSIDNGATFQASNIFNNLTAGTYDVVSQTAAGCEYTSQVQLVDPPLLTINTSNDTTVCENGTATVSAQSGGGNPPFTYHWDFTTDNAGSQNVSPTADSTVSVYVEDVDGCITVTETIDITVLPPIQLTPMTDQSICPEDMTYFETNASGGNGGPYSYAWDDGMGNSYPDTDSINVGNIGSTQVGVTVTDGCETSPQQVFANLTVYQLPNIQMTSDITQGCFPLAVSFTNLTSPAYNNTKWDFGDGGSAIENSGTITYTYDNPGVYDVTLFVESTDGCMDTVSFDQYIEAFDMPVADFLIAPNPTTMFNTTVQANNTSVGDIAGYNWSFTDGTPANSSEENPTVTFPDGEPGQYPVSLTVTDENGCQDTYETVVAVVSDVLLYAPNAFTPDGDPHNDTWGVVMDGINVYDFNLVIYNRWGEPVWESNNKDARWDGTYAATGEFVPNDTYVWVIRTKDQINDKKYEFSGHVTVLR